MAVVAPDSRVGLPRVLIVLCVTQIVSFGILMYTLPVLAPQIAVSTGWNLQGVVAGFSLAHVVSAAAGVPIGRLLDEHGPRTVMTLGSAVAVVALIAIAQAPTLEWFLAGWVAAGVAMSASLYQPAFAALTRWYGPDRVKALMTLTVYSALASTIFQPLTAALGAGLGWRRTYLVLAAGLGVIAIPAHAFGLRRPWPARDTADELQAARSDPFAIVRTRAFIALVIAVSLGAFTVYAVIMAIVPLLLERGVSTGTVSWALAVGGVGQVVGRLGYGRLVARSTVRLRTGVILGAIAATTLALGLLPGPPLALIVATLLAGSARGLFTLLYATAVADRWGARHYGHLTGVVLAPMTIAGAAGPWVATVAAVGLGGYPPVFLVLGATGCLAVVISRAAEPAAGPRLLSRN